MATTQNTFTGDGSNLGPFSFTFKWLEPTDIKVTVAGVLKTVGTHYNLQNLNYTTKTGGQVLFTAGNAPANGASIVVYRQTDDANLAATFYSGSAIRSQDLNDNFTQNLYVTQEANNNVVTANATANTALTNSNTAISTANAATVTANTASSNASAAVATANTASSNASAAVSTANTASSNATTAVNTANAATSTANNAASDAATALSTANSALSTANTASTNATNAVNTANSASSAASSAVSTANTASTTASNAVSTANSAVSTANSAVSTANSAVSTANSAVSTANAAASAVASAILYDIVANVAAIPGSPANNDAVEITNSTGIEGFSPLSGLPSGFVGNSALSVRLVYTTSGSTWNWIQYFPNDPETRYLKTGAGTVTSTNIVDGTIVNADINASAAIAGTKISPDFGSQNVTTTGTATAAALIPSGSSVPTNGVYLPSSNNVAISTNSSQRLLIDANGNVNIDSNTLYVDAVNNRVGLGSSSPDGNFTIGGLTNTGGQSVDAINVNRTDGLRLFGVKWDVSSNEVRFSGNTKNYVFRNGSGEAETVRITSGGLVGIGTTSASGKLHVSSGASSALISANADDLIVENNGNCGITIATPNSGIGAIRFADPQNDDSGAIFYNHNTEVLSLNTFSTERMRIDSSGRLLVGTSSARDLGAAGVHQLQVEGLNENLSSAAFIANVNSSVGPYLTLAKSRGTSNGSGTVVSSGDQLGSIQFNGADGTDIQTSAARIACEVDGTPGANDMPGRLVFSTTADGASSPTERLRIKSDGRVVIGANHSTAYGFLFTAVNPADTGRYFAIGQYSDTSNALSRDSGTTTYTHIGFNNGNGGVGSITTNGSATAYNTSSDYRLKENIVPLTGAADRLQQIPVHRFNFIAEPDKTVDGFLAHEAQAVVPECVTGTKDEVDDEGNPVYQGIDQSKLVPLLTAALQEALAEIENLKARVTALEP